jgi:hypothetical protein
MLLGGMKKALLFLVLINLAAISYSFAADKLSDVFGPSYDEALSYFHINRPEIESFFRPYNIDPQLAIAIVFPELIRYNRFRDFAETKALEVLYVRGGKERADFSIGQYQMKPSFVEDLEEELYHHPHLLNRFLDILDYHPQWKEQQVRQERIIRLNSKYWQRKYLACFIEIIQSMHYNRLSEHPDDLLLILASAYNMGIHADYFNMKRLSEIPLFPYGKSPSSVFSYYQVSLSFYKNSLLST